MTAQAVADGFGADEVVLDEPAPQILRSLDTECVSAGRADNGLRRQ